MNSSRTAGLDLELVDVGAPGCSPAELAGAMSAEQAADLARTLKALADPARLRVLALVAGNEGREVCVCDLTEPLGLSQPTVSHHLKVLVDAGFLTRDKRGVWAYFSLVPGALDAVVTALPGVRGRSGLT
ncbi:metalloregulator ArsR/SmtB family transcription factor [Modestobacter sp. VKM Ac-2979]|uniref:ArsR/SmtB family transcription factor n=1 Tax=unclassified Modestobacter TaxID=2643866 RepID=UPI0022AB939D|nr:MULTISPECIES: metalloregulator ArsR/SmtB family transcription factor [unclassified Modestobacter]MCZ2812797.1 metalloregulator ArsR/SmtB family transcription factor [Modestobacter sp. VKM Ac-2979]MCZ2843174.1 metalloregulator ArsR/SmtB family transcription factor [Modestobacter sp. VKM Ac-2980]